MLLEPGLIHLRERFTVQSTCEHRQCALPLLTGLYRCRLRAASRGPQREPRPGEEPSHRGFVQTQGRADLRMGEMAALAECQRLTLGRRQ